MLQVYNTLNKTKEEFRPLDGNNVRMYVCGPTVYDYPHIGNARSFAVFDTIRRYLEYSGYRVYYATNFTDVDDKMIDRANEEGISIQELASKFIAEYMRIAEQLNLKPATINPRATEHIDDIIEMVDLIVKNGKGYEVEGEIVGVMGIQHVEDVTLIRHAYVLTANQKQGIGKKLLLELRRQTDRPILIGTWADAAWAIRFYERHNFKRVPNTEKGRLLEKYWSIPRRQVETSVVLAERTWFNLSTESQ